MRVALGRRERLLLLAVAILHVVGIGFGLPASDGWDVDGIAPRDFLPGLIETFTPGHYFTYPPLHLALLTVLTLPVSAVALARAPSLAPPDLVATFLAVPTMTAFAYVARAVSLAASLANVALVGELAARAAGPRARAWAMAFAGVEAAGTYYAHTTNLDTPALTWALLALVRLASAVEHDRPRDLRRVALFAACAIATKDQAYAIFAVSVPAALVGWAAARGRRGLPELAKETAFLGVATVLLVLALDGALVNPSGFAARVRFLTGPASQDFAQFARTSEGRVAALRAAAGLLPLHYPAIVGLLAPLGLAAVAARARGRGGGRGRALVVSLVPALAIVSFTLAFNLVARRVEERFLLPQMQLLAVYAGAAVALAAERAGEQGPLGWAVRAAGAAVVSLGAHLSATVDANLLGDARYEAERWLASQVRPGDVVEVYGINVYLMRYPEGVRVERIDPRPVTRRNPVPGITEVSAHLSDMEVRRPRFVVVSSGYVWRYLQDREGHADGRVLPESQRANLDDADATGYFRTLFGGRTSYRVALHARYAATRLFPARPLHASLACDVFVFERP